MWEMEVEKVPMQTAQKAYLSLFEFATMIGRSYQVVLYWVKTGRVKAVDVEGSKKTKYRIAIEEATAVKEKIESGLWA